MSKSNGYRDIEKAFREIADAAAKLAELEESENCSETDMEAAMKDFMWAMTKMQSM